MWHIDKNFPIRAADRERKINYDWPNHYVLTLIIILKIL